MTPTLEWLTTRIAQEWAHTKRLREAGMPQAAATHEARVNRLLERYGAAVGSRRPDRSVVR